MKNPSTLTATECFDLTVALLRTLDLNDPRWPAPINRNGLVSDAVEMILGYPGSDRDPRLFTWLRNCEDHYRRGGGFGLNAKSFNELRGLLEYNVRAAAEHADADANKRSRQRKPARRATAKRSAALDMLDTLVNLHDGLKDGGNGITAADWREARAVVKAGV